MCFAERPISQIASTLLCPETVEERNWCLAVPGSCFLGDGLVGDILIGDGLVGADMFGLPLGLPLGLACGLCKLRDVPRLGLLL